MQPEFWRARWRTGQIGFHQSAVDRHLQRHWPTLKLADDSRVFVPLCGKSLDLLWLADRGHTVAGVELSDEALQAFCAENGIPARRRTLGNFDIYETAKLKLFCGDFLALTGDLLGPVAAIYDRASFISWSPEQRQAYVAHIRKLSQPGTQTLLIVMEYAQAEMAGPPFAVQDQVIEDTYGRDHSITRLSREDILANEPRLRARGLTKLHEVCYRLTRLS